MLKRDPAANVYARALMELGQKHQRVDEIFAELTALKEVFARGNLRVFFESPKIPREEKKKALERTLKGKVSGEVLIFLDVLIDRGRQMLFAQMVENYSERYDDFKKRTHVKVKSAVRLNEVTRSRLTQLLAKRLDREIVMHDAVDEQLLGGMTIRFGDTVVDGSIRTQLDKVKEVAASHRLRSDLFHED